MTTRGNASCNVSFCTWHERFGHQKFGYANIGYLRRTLTIKNDKFGMRDLEFSCVK